MAALMNLERTVKDFGRCPGHARNNYGIPFISHCVGSAFNGPCENDRSVTFSFGFAAIIDYT